jgi:hypothetical protein
MQTLDLGDDRSLRLRPAGLQVDKFTAGLATPVSSTQVSIDSVRAS